MLVSQELGAGRIAIYVFDEYETQDGHGDPSKRAIHPDAGDDTQIGAGCIQSDLKGDEDERQKQESPPWQGLATTRIHESKTKPKPACVAQSAADRIQPGWNELERDGNPRLSPKRCCGDRGKKHTAQQGSCAAQNDQRGKTRISDECDLVGQREKRGVHAVIRAASSGFFLAYLLLPRAVGIFGKSGKLV